MFFLGRHAFIGLGFADRGDSFDLLVAIQDHFKWVVTSVEGSLASAMRETLWSWLLVKHHLGTL